MSLVIPSPDSWCDMAEMPEPLAGDLVEASEALSEVFAARGIHYPVLGGVATILRGRPRFTQDIDILLDVPQLALPGLLDELADRGLTLHRETVIRSIDDQDRERN
jgi:hypothetical protein